MGLIGATAAILLRGWLTDKARVAYRRLLMIGLVIAMQIALDLITPEVSLLAHLSGTIIGFVAAYLLAQVHTGLRRSTQTRVREAPTVD